MPENEDRGKYGNVDAAKIISSYDSKSEMEIDRTHTNEKIFLGVNELEKEKRVCYFSLSGDQALKAFEEYYIEDKDNKELKRAVVQRLYFAVIMFDIVMIHCSDPLRRTEIKEILDEHSKWIEEGRIRFIANEDIDDWEQDYNKYIDRKYNAYQKGYFAELEAQSLRQPHIDEEYKRSVRRLLSKSKYYIRKDSTANSQFIELLKGDINHKNEQIFIDLDYEEDTMYENVKQFAVKKTVYQLLNAQYYGKTTKNNVEYVFDPDIVSEVFRDLRKALQKKQAVARPAIVEAIKSRIGETNEIQEVILDAITLRMDLLYCRMNAGKHLILEFHPSYEQQTIYKLECFEIFLKRFGFGRQHHLDSLTFQMVDQIIHTSEVEDFRRIFLASMADTHEQNNFNVKSGTTKSVFEDRCKRLLPADVKNEFSDICKILSGEERS